LKNKPQKSPLKELTLQIYHSNFRRQGKPISFKRKTGEILEPYSHIMMAMVDGQKVRGVLDLGTDIK